MTVLSLHSDALYDVRPLCLEDTLCERRGVLGVRSACTVGDPPDQGVLGVHLVCRRTLGREMLSVHGLCTTSASRSLLSSHSQSVKTP